jgi:hypothetical protein
VAATQQLEAAIVALEGGLWHIAITLAGAAEGMIERDGDNLYLFSFQKQQSRLLGFKEREVIRHLNRERDWLKHPTPDEPKVMHFGRYPAAVMIARAASKLEQKDWTPRIEAFREWYVANIDEIAQEGR